MVLQGWLLAQADETSGAISVAEAAVAALRCTADAISGADATGDRWCDAEICLVAADIALMAL